MTLTAPETPAPHTGTPVVIGIDPSLTATGIASSRGWTQTIGYEKARAKDPGITALPHLVRRRAMLDILHRITNQIGTPDLAVMETPAFSRSGGGAHERAWLWWEIYGYLDTHHIPTALMGTGQRCTYATGKGNASKEAVVDAVARRWPAWETQGDNNLADAVVFMAAGLDWLDHPITPMPKTHRTAIDKAIWPDLTLTGSNQ